MLRAIPKDSRVPTATAPASTSRIQRRATAYVVSLALEGVPRGVYHYDPRGHASDVYNFYGMTVAYSMVDALRHAGRNPTRESLLRAATHMDERTNPFLLPGVAVRTSPRDYFPITKARMVRYRGTRWVLFGPLLNAR